MKGKEIKVIYKDLSKIVDKLKTMKEKCEPHKEFLGMVGGEYDESSDNGERIIQSLNDSITYVEDVMCGFEELLEDMD